MGPLTRAAGLGASVLALVVGGCGALEKDVSYKVPMKASGSADCNTNGTFTRKLADDPTFAKYKDAPVDIELAGARVRVTAVDPANETATASGSATVVAPDGTEIPFGRWENLPIRVGGEVPITFTQEDAAHVISIVTAPPYELTVRTEGSGSGGKCLFSFDLLLDLKVAPDVTRVL